MARSSGGKIGAVYQPFSEDIVGARLQRGQGKECVCRRATASGSAASGCQALRRDTAGAVPGL